MGVKNNTEFDIDWLRSKGFVGNRDTGDEVDPACPEKSETFRYRELMDYEGYKEIKILIEIDLRIPAVSSILYHYNPFGSLKTREYNGDITSKEMLILLLEAICPEYVKKFNN